MNAYNKTTLAVKENTGQKKVKEKNSLEGQVEELVCAEEFQDFLNQL